MSNVTSNVKWKTKSQSTSKIPSHLYPRDLIYRAAYLVEVLGETPNRAMTDLLKRVPGLLQSYGLSINTDFPKPGQSISGIRSEFSKMVGTDAYWWNLAKGHGFTIGCDEPQTGTTNGTPPGTVTGLTVAQMIQPLLPVPRTLATSKAKKAKLPVAPPAPMQEFVSQRGLEVAVVDPDPNSPPPWTSYQGQRRRAILEELEKFDDMGQRFSSATQLTFQLVRRKFMQPDGNTGENQREIELYLSEMGIKPCMVPYKFPVLKNGEVVEKAIMESPTDKEKLAAYKATATAPPKDDPNDPELQDLISQLTEATKEQEDLAAAKPDNK